MKKLLVCTLCSMLIFVLTACHFPSINVSKIEETTIEKIVEAIEENDLTLLKKQFSGSARKASPTLDCDIEQFFEIFDGEITAYYQAGHSEVSRSAEYGRISMNIKSSYIIETKNHKYYIVTNYCSLNTFQLNGIGLKCINIITDDLYQSSYVYRGDGKWTPGITFDTRIRKPN